MSLPSGFFNWNSALRGAFLKGAAACLEGQPITDCPYQDKRKYCGRLTWSRAFMTAWKNGWAYANADRADALITMEHRNTLLRAYR